VYVEFPGGTFWDKVDAHLLLIRTMADEENWKITKYVVNSQPAPLLILRKGF